MKRSRERRTARDNDDGARAFSLAVLAALLVVGLVLVGLAAGGLGGARAAPSSGGPSAAVAPSAIAATTIYLNRSQAPTSTYVPEYVSVNNSTTLTAVPATLTVVASSCRWVTVLNLTKAASPVSIFHNVKYANVTSANGSGTFYARGATTSFQVCGGHAVWINYAYWSYAVYTFSSVGLQVNATVKVGGFSAYPGSTTIPANTSAKIGKALAAQFVIAANLSAFTVTLPTPVNGSTTCDYTGQICSYPQYRLSASTDVANTTKAPVLEFQKAACGAAVPGLLCLAPAASATYENWTLNYTSSKIGADTSTGSFYQGTDSFFTVVFYTFWYAWVVVLLVVVVIVLLSRKHR